jgi:hypothetical protein
MGVLRSTQSMEAEVEEMRAALLLGPGLAAWRSSGTGGAAAAKAGAEEGAAEPRAVCVTGGISFLGLAVVDRLLRHGYTVRLALETQGWLLSPLADSSILLPLHSKLKFPGLQRVWKFGVFFSFHIPHTDPYLATFPRCLKIGVARGRIPQCGAVPHVPLLRT